jgi:L-serine dehydratase
VHIAGRGAIPFDQSRNFIFHGSEQLARHPNALRFVATDINDREVLAATYYSVGGGFIIGDESNGEREDLALRYPFSSGEELLKQCREANVSVSTLMLISEQEMRDKIDICERLLTIWRAMSACIDRGIERGGLLPGYLNVPRRAQSLYRQLQSRTTVSDPLDAMDWLNLYALAVSEENASGGRVVTAPTNGAAGILPAVIRYYLDFVPDASEERVVEFLLTAGAVATLCKEGASISGAEVGCQGEVGSACAMAAAGLCEILGGQPAQVENAAEIAIEQHLGLTCDPVGGFVQIPCIERNAIAAVTAVNAARMALAGNGTHRVSLDQALKTMRQTGTDMKTKYKETSRGGLAVNVTEC